MSARFWKALDTLAHFLHCPGMAGKRAARARWYHRIHVIPGWLLERACDRYDLALGCTPGELRRTAPVACEATPEDHALADAAMAHAVTEEMDGDGAPAWFATVPALKGVWGAGDSPREALADLRESIPGWFAVRRVLELDAPPADADPGDLAEADTTEAEIDAMMAGADPDETFYEDDEPVEKITAAFERAPKGVTGRYDDA